MGKGCASELTIFGSLFQRPELAQLLAKRYVAFHHAFKAPYIWQGAVEGGYSRMEVVGRSKKYQGMTKYILSVNGPHI